MTGSSPEDDETDEATWQAIIEGLGPLTVPPADSDSAQTSPQADAPSDEIEPRAASSWRGPASSERSLADLFNDDHLGLTHDEEDEVEDAFVPPDPGPIMDGDPLLTLAWIGAVGGPFILFILALFWRSAPSLLFWIAGALALAGLAILVWRMPHTRDPEDFDDGARV
ncbi:MAG TPA: hypothetical protein VK030_03985 [Actinomycetales bacterium]|nr:hypothetical protein [Actinomycetales bacterium]